MPDQPNPFGELDLNLVASTEGASVGAPEPDTPFRVLLLGDFGGRANRGELTDRAALSNWRAREIDRDNFDAVLSKLAPRLRLSLSGNEQAALELRFESLEDFHPDRLYDRLELFQTLRQTRKRLRNPSTFAEAAAEVRRWMTVETPTTARDSKQTERSSPAETSSDEASSADASRDLIEQMLSEQPSTARAQSDASGLPDMNQFLSEIVRPHLVADTDAQAEALTDSLDAAAASLMRAILHHPDFQALEAAWRAAYFVVSRVETDAHLKFYVLDITREELTADLRAAEDLRRCALYKILVEQTAETFGGQPWAFIAADYAFDATRADAALLGRLAKIARQANAPFVARADARMITGSSSFAEPPDPDDWRPARTSREDDEAWRAMRSLPEAAYLGLALPRFLLRLPYGPDTEPAERFDFEEMTPAPEHEKYLLGNPSFACAYLLAEGFSRDGWDARHGDVLQIEGLPMHVYESEGESVIKPCAEVLISVRAAEMILDRGIMPLLSFKNQDEARLAGFQSLADPPTQLAGPWS